MGEAANSGRGEDEGEGRLAVEAAEGAAEGETKAAGAGVAAAQALRPSTNAQARRMALLEDRIAPECNRFRSRRGAGSGIAPTPPGGFSRAP